MVRELYQSTGLASRWLFKITRFTDLLSLRLFLFQTALASGVDAGFEPFNTEENRGTASLIPLPAFATSRGLEAERAVVPGGGVLELVGGLSPGFGVVLLGLPLDARNVLFTETALNVAGFFAEDPDRPWPLSAREASVSDPPLMLTSAELTGSSTPTICLFVISSLPKVWSLMMEGAGGDEIDCSACKAGRYSQQRDTTQEPSIRKDLVNSQAVAGLGQRHRQGYRPKALLPSSDDVAESVEV